MKKIHAPICLECHNQCEMPCSAYNKLHDIYKETKTKAQIQLIKQLREYLSIVDAEPCEEMALLAEQVINKIPELGFINDFSIRVGYVKSFESKSKSGKMVYADCRKVTPVYGAYLPYDFIITFYDQNVTILTPNQLKILMWHELKHIGINERGLTVVPHDVEDFHSIMDEHGTRWNEYEAEVRDILE